MHSRHTIGRRVKILRFSVIPFPDQSAGLPIEAIEIGIPSAEQHLAVGNSRPCLTIVIDTGKFPIDFSRSHIDAVERFITALIQFTTGSTTIGNKRAIGFHRPNYLTVHGKGGRVAVEIWLRQCYGA